MIIFVLNLPIAFATKMTSGRTSTTDGTAVQLSTTSTNCDIVYVTASEDNTDVVVIGGSTVDVTDATRNGTILFPGQTIAFPAKNILNLYLDVEVDNEDVHWNCVNT